MKTILAIFLLMCVTGVHCFSSVTTSVTAQVSEANGTKYYNYMLTNSPEGGSIYGLMIVMPRSAARLVTAFTCSKPNWYQDYSVCYEDSLWLVMAVSGAEVMPGESATFTLTTPATVPTLEGYQPSFPSNCGWFEWGKDTQFGSYLLPVPGFVPEPSSLAVLGAGLLPLAFGLRRRRIR